MNLLPPFGATGVSLGSVEQPWHDAVLSGSLTDASGNASTPVEIKTARTQAAAAIPSSEKGAASGVATLDAGTRIPIAQIPESVSKNLGYFATEAALTTAHPTASAGNFCIVGETDTVWVWDTDTEAWVDGGGEGAVISVNGHTGAVIISASDVGAAAASHTHAQADVSIYTTLSGFSRLEPNQFSATNIATLAPAGTHLRYAAAATRPTTSSAWKHGLTTDANGTICGVAIPEPSAGESLFVEADYLSIAIEMIAVCIPNFWAYATGTALLASGALGNFPCVWRGPTASLIGAIGVKSRTADTGATQPTLMVTAGGTDLMSAALSVSATETTTGVVTAGQEIAYGEAIDIDCESTGTNSGSSVNQSDTLYATFVIVRS